MNVEFKSLINNLRKANLIAEVKEKDIISIYNTNMPESVCVLNTRTEEINSPNLILTFYANQILSYYKRHLL